MNAEVILKALCVIGFIFEFVIVFRQIKKNKATPEGQAEWEKEMKHFKWNAGVGLIANFFDTLGIGSYAGSSSAFKLKTYVVEYLSFFVIIKIDVFKFDFPARIL